jgi:multicomponent Na+:H+ antiporter subunit E
LRLTLRVAVFALLWWALTGGARDSWGIGLPLVLIAVAVSLGLSPARGGPLSVTGTLRFLPFFLWHSLRGGVDVARRAFHPSLPIRPVLVEYRLRVPPGPGPVFMANVVSLLPGSLAAGLDGDRLLVHVLDRNGDFRRELSALERRVADLFGEPLD